MNMRLVPTFEVLDRVLLFHVIDHDIVLSSARPSILQPKDRMEAGSALVGPTALVCCWRKDELRG